MAESETTDEPPSVKAALAKGRGGLRRAFEAADATETTASRSAMSGELTSIEQAMMWERMSGERLSDVERQRIMDGGDFVVPTTQTTVDTLDIAVSIDVLRRNARFMTDSARTCRNLAASLPGRPDGIKYRDKADRADALVVSYTRVADWLGRIGIDGAMTDQTETTADDALKQPTIIDRAQAEIDRLRQLNEEAYYEGVRDGENCNWWESYARKKRDGLAI
jgi:hypothetical protein